jgi:hypothetical protein
MTDESREGTDLGPLLQEALTAALTSVVSLMPLHVTLALHSGPVLMEGEIVWSVPLGTVTFDDRKRIEFISREGTANG